MFIKHSPVWDNHLKSLRTVSEKRLKKIVISLFRFLNTCGLLHCENSHFLGQLLLQLFYKIWCHCIQRRIHTSSKILEPLAKSVITFLVVNSFRKKLHFSYSTGSWMRLLIHLFKCFFFKKKSHVKSSLCVKHDCKY